MGVLLFKGNTKTSSITNIRISNQQLTFQKFRNPERSINKSLTTYQWKEKLECELQFQYENDEYYRVLRALLDDRNAQQEALLFMPVPYSDSPTTSVLAPETVYNKGYFIHADIGAPWLHTYSEIVYDEFSSSNYTSISDPTSSSYLSITAAAPNYSGVVLTFDLTNFKNTFDVRDLRRLSLLWLGLSSSPLRFFIWSESAGAWYLISDSYYYQTSDLPLLHKQSVASFSLPQGFTSISANFLDSNFRAKFLICSGTPGNPLMLNNARLLVNGYYVFPESPEDIENYATHFTGAGRTGSLNLLEI